MAPFNPETSRGTRRRRRAAPRALLIACVAGIALVAGLRLAPGARGATPGAAADVPRLGANPDQPISLDAAATDVDYRTNTVTFRDIVISQGPTRVQASSARATGLNFDNSRWSFDGNVRIDAERHGNLRSDAAVVEFRDNRIARATITGTPAQFEQQRTAPDRLARGRAGEIVYDVADGLVRLSNEAWLTDGVNEISGPQIVYNIRDEKFRAAAPSTDAGNTPGRVHITIAPTGTQPGRAPAPPPAGAPRRDPG